VLAGLPVVQDQPQEVISRLNAHSHNELGLNTLWQFLFDDVVGDIRLIEPFSVWAADTADEKQFVSFSDSVQILRIDADDVRDFEPLVNT